MRKGWFELPGQQGDRTVAEQMLGLDAALAEARGATVLDLGSAEGAIALEFARAGAKEVLGVDSNAPFIEVANALAAQMPPPFRVANFKHRNINLMVRDAKDRNQKPRRFDIVLALAVLHKLHWPAEAAEYAAESTGRLLVVRLPLGSTGTIGSKHFPGRDCDLVRHLPKCGLRLEATLPGPRDELVQYWRRAA